MLSVDILNEVVDLNKLRFSKSKTISRVRTLPIPVQSVIVVMGVRRCGKSTLLQQLLKNKEKTLFLNLEDTRLEGFELSDFIKIEQIAVSKDVNCLIFDEIQNIQGWEKYVRSAVDNGFEVFVTGSNASMLSRELGTKLTGRNLQVELFPFNYTEYLVYTKQEKGEKSFLKYLKDGGFPEYLATKNSDYLRTLLRDIVIRDICVRRQIRNEHVILRLALHLISNVGKEVSFNNMAKLLEIKSVRSVIDYCDYLKDSYLVDFIPRYSRSIKQQIVNPKKVYAIDTGLACANSLSFSRDDGRLLENAVYLHLRQTSNDIMYYNNGKSECDFLIRKNEVVIEAIQVCWNLTQDNLKRELEGVKCAMAETGAVKGSIITLNQDDYFDDIKVISVWKWMSQQS